MAFRGKRGKTKKYNIPTKCLLKTGDPVVVISGKDKKEDGKASGKIKLINRKKGTVLIDEVNVVKKHKKRTSQDQPPQIVDIALPIPICKVQYFYDKIGKGIRLGTKIENGKRVRYAKKYNIVID